MNNPYLTDYIITSGFWDIITQGDIYRDTSDSSAVLCSSKLRTLCREWNSDTSTFVGDYSYSNWEPMYHTKTHSAKIMDLDEGTDYSMWYEIDAQSGPDSTIPVGLGIYQTKPWLG